MKRCSECGQELRLAHGMWSHVQKGSCKIQFIRATESERAAESTTALPIRRLVAAGCSYDYCLVYYERGGARHTWHVALFHWAPEATKFEWGGTAPGGLATIEDVRRAVLAGAIKPPAAFW